MARLASKRWGTTALSSAFALALSLSTTSVFAEDGPATQVVKDAKAKAIEAREALRAERDKARETLRAERDKAKETLHDARDKARDALQDAKHELHQKLDDAKQGVDEKLDDAKRALKSAEHKAVSAAEDVREKASEQAQKTAAKVQAQARDVEQAVREAIGKGDRPERVRHARRTAWRKLAHDAGRPRDVPRDVPQSVRAELRQHARRVAHLARIRELAVEKKDSASVERCDSLRKREDERHAQKLAKLWQTERPAGNSAAHKNAAPKDLDDQADPPEESPEEEDTEQEP